MANIADCEYRIFGDDDKINSQNIKDVMQSNKHSNSDRGMNCAVDLSETKKRAVDVFLLTLIEQFGAQGIAEALGIDTQIVVDYYTKCGGEPLHENEK